MSPASTIPLPTPTHRCYVCNSTKDGKMVFGNCRVGDRVQKCYGVNKCEGKPCIHHSRDACVACNEFYPHHDKNGRNPRRCKRCENANLRFRKRKDFATHESWYSQKWGKWSHRELSEYKSKYESKKLIQLSERNSHLTRGLSQKNRQQNVKVDHTPSHLGKSNITSNLSKLVAHCAQDFRGLANQPCAAHPPPNSSSGSWPVYPVSNPMDKWSAKTKEKWPASMPTPLKATAAWNGVARKPSANNKSSATSSSGDSPVVVRKDLMFKNHHDRKPGSSGLVSNPLNRKRDYPFHNFPAPSFVTHHHHHQQQQQQQQATHEGATPLDTYFDDMLDMDFGDDSLLLNWMAESGNSANDENGEKAQGTTLLDPVPFIPERSFDGQFLDDPIGSDEVMPFPFNPTHARSESQEAIFVPDATSQDGGPGRGAHEWGVGVADEFEFRACAKELMQPRKKLARSFACPPTTLFE